MPTGNHDSLDRDAAMRSYRVMSLELTHLRSALAASPFPLVALHALVLIGLERDIDTSGLGEQIGLDSHSVEQLVHALARSGELRALRHEEAHSSQRLKLTARGHRTLSKLHSACNQHVSSALALLDMDHHFTLTLGDRGYRHVFSSEAERRR